MSGFQHDIAGGSGDLIATSVQSPNFVHATSGWQIRKDGTAEFHSIVLPNGQGVSVYFQGTAPVTTHTGDLWYNTANGLQLSQWNGSAWVAFQIGTGAIASGAITNALLNAAVTARSIGGITTTISSTAPGSPVTSDIWIDEVSAGPPPSYLLKQWNGSAWVPLTANATDVINANTINAGLLAAGIIYAGIVNGTILQGVQIEGDAFLIYNGTPGAGNLIAWIAGSAGTDSFGNAYTAGFVLGVTSTGQIQLQPNIGQPFNITTAIAGTFGAMAQYFTNDVNEMMPGMFGGVLLGTGTATKMTSAWHSPFGTEGAAIVLEAQNDAGTDTPVITLGTVTMPSGVMVFTPIMTLTPYAMVLYSGSSGQVSVTQTSGSGTIPIPAGVTTVKAECWGGGGGGAGGSQSIGATGGYGGGGGEYAAESSLAVTGGGSVSYSVGSAGSAGAAGAGTGGNGGNSTLTGTSVTVTAHGGSGGTISAVGGGGSGSTNTTHANGGGGGNGGSFGSGGQFGNGGGGGSSGGISAGNSGLNATAGGGGGGAAAVVGGGAGGNGANSTSAGTVGGAPGGGGGGGGANTNTPAQFAGGAGSAGQVRITYSTGLPAVGFSINFGAAFTDQFGNSIPAGPNVKTDTAGALVIKPNLELDPPSSTPATPSTGVKLYAEPVGGSAPTGVTMLTSSGMAGRLPVVQTDIATHTNANSAGVITISAAWTIPANDAQVGTIYELEVPFQAVMEGNSLELGLSVNGSTSFTTDNVISGSIVSAGAAVVGTIRVKVVVITTGSSGTFNSFIDGTITAQAQTLFTNSGSLSGNAVGIGTAFNTTVSNNIRVNSQWGTTAAGQTVSGYGSKFTRSGP